MYQELYDKLIGDGIQDDTDAIQALLDSGLAEVHLPSPQKNYLINKTLRINSDTELVLGRATLIRLADNADCHMITNAKPDSENISITGGIWDLNNKNQTPNPMQIPPPEGSEAVVIFIMNFDTVKNLNISSMTLRDPVIFAITLSYVKQFTIDNITFDFNYGNPNATNMDGIHLNGGCCLGRITNLMGACYDDLVALNADEGRGGPIEDIQIDGIFSRDCHSAVRILTRGQWVRRIHISNVYGTFFQYCVGITRYSDDGDIGRCDQIHLDGIYASKALRIPVYGKEGGYVYALIWIEGGIKIGNLQISQLHRREKITCIPTIELRHGTDIETLSIEHVSQENYTKDAIPFFLNSGCVNKLFLRDIQVKNDAILVNNGIIEKRYFDDDTLAMM